MKMAFISVKDDEYVRTITLTRPSKRNALNKTMTQELVDALESAATCKRIRSITLLAAGSSFCAGQDINEMDEVVGQAELIERLELTRRLHSMLREIPKPLVAGAQGSALGGGAALMLGCDLVIGGQSLRIGYPEVKKNIVPGIVVASVNQHLGPKIAFEMMILGRILNAEEALGLGIINRVVSDDDLARTSRSMANELSMLDPSIIGELKVFLYETRNNRHSEAIDKGHAIVRRLTGG